VKETAIEKPSLPPFKERAQYALAFGVIALMLYIAGFPVFLLFFIGVLTFFIWKVFSADRRNDTRRIFEFYLSANEILRDDDRRWFGFEMQETIGRGEAIISSMSTAPPLVHFALGALHHKLGDHASATKYLSAVEENGDEAKIIFPTKELRDYVRVLRKIERAPAEAPLTSAAIRSLERARKNRTHDMLEVSRMQVGETASELEKEQNTRKIGAKMKSVADASNDHDDDALTNAREVDAIEISFTDNAKEENAKARGAKSRRTDRQTISEVLHDIYDANIS